MSDVLAQGYKADDGKILLELLPPDVIEEVGHVLTFGAHKYAPRNWEKGIKYGRVIGAALRHIFAIMRGEDRDPETGRLHAAHAICCMMFLCGYQLRGMVAYDDRNKVAPKVDVWQAGFSAMENAMPADDRTKVSDDSWRGHKA